MDKNLRKIGDVEQGDMSDEGDQQKIPAPCVDYSSDATREAARRLLEKRSNCVGVCAVGII